LHKRRLKLQGIVKYFWLKPNFKIYIGLFFFWLGTILFDLYKTITILFRDCIKKMSIIRLFDILQIIKVHYDRMCTEFTEFRGTYWYNNILYGLSVNFDLGLTIVARIYKISILYVTPRLVCPKYNPSIHQSSINNIIYYIMWFNIISYYYYYYYYY